MIKELPVELKNGKKWQSDFFASSDHLCRLYGISLPDPQPGTFPINIFSTFRELSEKLAVLDPELTLKLIALEDGSFSLATIKKHHTGMTLFYLPVEPLHRFLQDERRKSAAELLLSVCAYLYQIGGIPYHTERSSYLKYIYDMLTEWGSEADYFEEEGEQERFISEIDQIKVSGEQLLQKIAHPAQLKALKKRCQGFKPACEVETTLKEIAQRVLGLMERYPGRSIMDGIYGGMFGESGDGEAMIYAEHYLSFFWSSSDSLYDQLMDSVNAELNEFSEIDEPISIQIFDSPQKAVTHDLSFEQEFFDLLHDISDNLNDFNHEKYHSLTG